MQKKYEIVLMIVANESYEKRTKEMNTLINECNLVDPHLAANPFSSVETHARGSGKIDYIFTSPKIHQAITYTQITPYLEFIVSDHRALIIDIDNSQIEEGDITVWKRPERNFLSHEAAARKKFIEGCHRSAAKLHWMKRLQKIEKTR